MLNCQCHRHPFFCPNTRVKLFSNAKIENPDFLRDLRDFTSSLNLSPDHWVDYLVDLYRDYQGMVTSKGTEVFLDTEAFEANSIREWFRDWACKPLAPNQEPRLREESRERIRVLATILATRFPFEASMWGVRPANDNRSPFPREHR